MDNRVENQATNQTDKQAAKVNLQVANLLVVLQAANRQVANHPAANRSVTRLLALRHQAANLLRPSKAPQLLVLIKIISRETTKQASRPILKLTIKTVPLVIAATAAKKTQITHRRKRIKR